jgi:hypothetical protein
MPKPTKKPASPAPAHPPGKPGRPQAPSGARDNRRLQADNRWQRTKRYGWDSR